MTHTSEERFRQAAEAEGGVPVSAGARIAHVRMAVEAGPRLSTSICLVSQKTSGQQWLPKSRNWSIGPLHGRWGRSGTPRGVPPTRTADVRLPTRCHRRSHPFARASWPGISITPGFVAKMALYYGMVTYVDEEFGRILKKLDDLGLRDNTIILYTADHGEMLGDRGIWYKNSFYDGSASIPFIWSFPKALPQGKVVNTPAMNMDIFPTLCDLCGLPQPPGLEGTSLAPVMKGADDGKDRYALSENYRGGAAGRMIRSAKWKYFFYTNGDEYLYDMEADPGEENNLIKDPAYRKTADDLKQRASAGWVRTPTRNARNAAAP